MFDHIVVDRRATERDLGRKLRANAPYVTSVFASLEIASDFSAYRLVAWPPARLPFARIMTSFIDTFLLVCAALFPMVNPIGGAPIFLGLTEDRSAAERGRLALWIAVNSFLLLAGSLLIGSYVLDFFGISIAVVRIGGGLLLTALGWKLINADPDPDHAAARNHTAAMPDSFYPLTLPLTVGPGCMAVTITLATQHPKGAHWDQLLMFDGAVLAGLFAIALSVYFCYRFAGRLVALLGHGGMTVIVRLTAFILMCIGIQVIWSGWTGLQAATH